MTVTLALAENPSLSGGNKRAAQGFHGNRHWQLQAGCRRDRHWQRQCVAIDSEHSESEMLVALPVALVARVLVLLALLQSTSAAESDRKCSRSWRRSETPVPVNGLSVGIRFQRLPLAVKWPRGTSS